MGRFAVAVTMTQDKPSGVMNIVTNLNIYGAVSRDEAKGKAFAAAQDANPAHQVFHITAVQIDAEMLEENVDV